MLLPTTERRKVWLALIGIVALAAFVRYWHLTTLPPGYWYDEAHKPLVALQILRGERFPVYITDGFGFDAGYYWLVAGWFALFGPSYFAPRLISALLGTVTVLLTFWAVRTLYRSHPSRDSLSLLSAGLLSVMLWHVHWSRLGLEVILVPLFAIAVLGLLALAWQRENAWLFFAGGLMLGLSQYSYPAVRLLPLGALLIFAILADWQPRKLVGFGLSFLAGALLTYAPLGLFFLANPNWFLNRVSFASSNARAGGLAFVLAATAKTLLSINFHGDVLPRHNLAGRPALDGIASIWMWTGVAALARERGHWRAHLALLAALLVCLLPGFFSDGAPAFGRTLGAVPLLTVLPALGMTAAWNWRGGRAWTRVLIIGSLVISAGFNLYDYFVRYPKQPGLFDAFEIGQWTLTQAAVKAAEAGGVGYLLLNESNLNHPETDLAREWTRGDLRIVNAQTCLAYPSRTTTDTVFAVMPDALPRVLAEYPQARQTNIMHEPEVYLDGAILTVPAGQSSVNGEAASLATFGDAMELLAAVLPAETFAPGAVVPVTLRWRALKRSDIRYTSFVHLVSEFTPYITGADSEPCAASYPTDQWHAGEVVEYQLLLTLPSDLVPGTYELAAGMYDWTTGARLPVSQANQREPDRAMIGSISVK